MKKQTPPMKRTMHRTGLHVYARARIDPAADPIEEVHALLTAGTPMARLARIEQRAAAYADVPAVGVELETIRDIATTGRDRELHLALLALERGLDLLDTGRYLDAVLRDQKTQAGRRKGAVTANTSRGKLPSRDDLIAEISDLQVAATRSERDARSIIRRKYGATRSALSQKLANKKR